VRVEMMPASCFVLIRALPQGMDSFVADTGMLWRLTRHH